MNLSFSLLPSVLDGWRSVIDLQYLINWYTPFNGLAELYFFGWPYQVFFGIVYAICIRMLTRAMARMGTLVGMLIGSPAFYSFFAFHQYPVRNGFRLLVYSAVVSWFVLWLMARRAPRARSVSGGRSHEQHDMGRAASVRVAVAKRPSTLELSGGPGEILPT
jgi:hypothetical protein